MISGYESKTTTFRLEGKPSIKDTKSYVFYQQEPSCSITRIARKFLRRMRAIMLLGRMAVMDVNGNKGAAGINTPLPPAPKRQGGTQNLVADLQH